MKGWRISLLCILLMYSTSGYAKRPEKHKPKKHEIEISPASPPKDIFSAEYVKTIIDDSISGLEEYLQKKIKETKVIEFPFPYIVIGNIFPEKFYQKALSLWPASSEFVADAKAPKRLHMNYGCIDQTNLSKEQKIFWRIFGEVVVNRYIKPALIQKLKPYFQMKYGMQNFPIEELTLNDFVNTRQDALYEATSHYQHGAHIDQLNFFATILIYFPSDDTHSELGTAVYYGDSASNPNSTHNSGLQKVGKILFKPNTLHCMLQSPIAWHGVEASPYQDDYIRRYCISFIAHSPEFIDRHYKGVYNRSAVDDYFFDHRFLSKKNWLCIWDKTDFYE